MIDQDVSVDALKRALTSTIFALPEEAIYAHYSMDEAHRIYEETGGFPTLESLRWRLYNDVAEGTKELDVRLFYWTTFKVRMLAFQEPNKDGTVCVREVKVPTHQLKGEIDHDLELIWHFGQNDFQPNPKCCSVSMGDVVEFNDCIYVAASFGFKEISEGQYNELLALEQRDRHFWGPLRD